MKLTIYALKKIQKTSKPLLRFLGGSPSSRAGNWGEWQNSGLDSLRFLQSNNPEPVTKPGRALTIGHYAAVAPRSDKCLRLTWYLRIHSGVADGSFTLFLNSFSTLPSVIPPRSHYNIASFHVSFWCLSILYALGTLFIYDIIHYQPFSFKDFIRISFIFQICWILKCFEILTTLVVGAKTMFKGMLCTILEFQTAQHLPSTCIMLSQRYFIKLNQSQSYMKVPFIADYARIFFD